VRSFGPIFTKFDFSSKIFLKDLIIKFHYDPSNHRKPPW